MDLNSEISVMSQADFVNNTKELGGLTPAAGDYRTYFDKDTGKYMGAYFGPIIGTKFENHPSLSGQVGCSYDTLDLKTMTLIKGTIPLLQKLWKKE